jgi:hypothetical protein
LKGEVLALFLFFGDADFVEDLLGVDQTLQIVTFRFLVALLHELSDLLLFSEVLSQVWILKQLLGQILEALFRRLLAFQRGGPCRAHCT